MVLQAILIVSFQRTFGSCNKIPAGFNCSRLKTLRLHQRHQTDQTDQTDQVDDPSDPSATEESAAKRQKR